jgi:hypothetical protein
MHLEDGFSSAEVGPVHHHLAVESTRAEERRVQDVGSVGGGHDDHALGGVEPVHFHQELVQGLLSLVVGAERAAEGSAPRLADGVQLVQEHQARGLLLGLVEQLSDPGRAQADEHLDELRPRHEEEGDLGLTGHGSGQECLPAARRPEQEHSLGDPAPEALVFLGSPEELDDLLQLLDRLVQPGHIGEGGLHVLPVVDLHALAAQVEGSRRATPGHPTEHEEPQHTQQKHRKQDVQQDPGQSAGLLGRGLDALLVELIDQRIGLVVDRQGGMPERAALHLPLDGVAGDGDLGHPVRLEIGQERAQRHSGHLGLERPPEQEQEEDADEHVHHEVAPPAPATPIAAAAATQVEPRPPAPVALVVALIGIVRHLSSSPAGPAGLPYIFPPCGLKARPREEWLSASRPPGPAPLGLSGTMGLDPTCDRNEWPTATFRLGSSPRPCPCCPGCTRPRTA